jgi:hypothetical protein
MALKHHNQEGPTSTAEAMNSRGKMHIKTCFTYRLEQQELSADIGSNLIGFPTKPHKEIIRLYITVKKPLLMHVLNPINLKIMNKECVSTSKIHRVRRRGQSCNHVTS